MRDHGEHATPGSSDRDAREYSPARSSADSRPTIRSIVLQSRRPMSGLSTDLVSSVGGGDGVFVALVGDLAVVADMVL